MPCDSRQEQRMNIWVWQSTELIVKEILTKEASHGRKLFLKVQILNVTRLTVNAKKRHTGNCTAPQNASFWVMSPSNEYSAVFSWEGRLTFCISLCLQFVSGHFSCVGIKSFYTGLVALVKILQWKQKVLIAICCMINETFKNQYSPKGTPWHFKFILLFFIIIHLLHLCTLKVFIYPQLTAFLLLSPHDTADVFLVTY